jgi:hypothetical protein
MTQCSACEFESAVLICSDCRICNKNSLFCIRCSESHLEKNSNHCLIKNVKKRLLCSNCESSWAKFCCRDCPVFEQGYCLGCSIIHPKVKASRNHRIYQIDNDDEDFVFTGLSIYSLAELCKFKLWKIPEMTPIAEFLDVLNFFDFTAGGFQFLVFCTVIVALFFLGLRRTIGNFGFSTLTIAGTIGVLRFIRSRQSKIRSIK